MIGVVVNPTEEAVVREFFELFKTPWEVYQPHRRYEVLLCAGEVDVDEYTAKLILRYSGRELLFDREQGTRIVVQGRCGSTVAYDGLRIPIYGYYLLFQENSDASPRIGPSETTIYRYKSNDREVVRIGFDLFAEVRTLLTSGQPPADAAIPTLELHIALLRKLIVSGGVPLAEIPPVPGGYRFIACLTHDVDHPMLRRHIFDHTMIGFLYRATFGSLLKALQGQMGWASVWRNWGAALKLPLVHLGLAKDPWSEFDRYIALEGGVPSSFFVIPFEGRPGRSRDGGAPSARAARYGAADISDQLQKVISAGGEVGLHGIDAWLDDSAAREELDEIRGITGAQEIGVRMHWLYFDEDSPVALERAGASYDSTVGYNQTIGYRAGTMQAYKPFTTSQLMELPLQVMDTALFFPGYLHLSQREARERVGQCIDDAERFGGCLTVNWHDRSIAPERLWGNCYVDLLADLRARGAWLTTASHAVSWFRKRRSTKFEDLSWEGAALRAKITVPAGDVLPCLRLRVHKGQERYLEALLGPLPAGSLASANQKRTIDVNVGVLPEMQTVEGN